jgi:EAL and modified HD-GYP domain-containing signal transduction protein
MAETPVLSQFALGYSPIIDRQRSAVACRLALAPTRSDIRIDGAALLDALAPIAPVAPRNGLAPLVLDVAGESLLRALLDARPQLPFAVELPAFMLADASFAQAAQAAAAAGTVLWTKGRGAAEPPGNLLGGVRAVVFERSDAAGAPRGAMLVGAGANSSADIDALQRAGAAYTAGWPFDDPLPAVRAKVAPEAQVIVDLIRRVDREEPVDRLEAALKGDPTLAFRLMRYLNSAALGLAVEITSFRQALLILGHHKLKRWLALLLASAGKDASAKPLLYGAVRRGLLMEELGHGTGDAALRGEMFICGVFSLLDRLLKQAFAELLKSVPVPERVQQALVDESGPFWLHLELVRAIERGSSLGIHEAAEPLLLAPADVNRAVIAALGAARHLD